MVIPHDESDHAAPNVAQPPSAVVFPWPRCAVLPSHRPIKRQPGAVAAVSSGHADPPWSQSPRPRHPARFSVRSADQASADSLSAPNRPATQAWVTWPTGQPWYSSQSDPRSLPEWIAQHPARWPGPTSAAQLRLCHAITPRPQAGLMVSWVPWSRRLRPGWGHVAAGRRGHGTPPRRSRAIMLPATGRSNMVTPTTARPCHPIPAIGEAARARRPCHGVRKKDGRGRACSRHCHRPSPW